MTTLTDALRKAIRQSGVTRYELWKATGVGQDILSKFMRGGGIKLATADRLAAHFNLELTKRKVMVTHHGKSHSRRRA